MKVFLGGTCNESKWREELIKTLKIDYFNPVVEDWTPECQEVEKREKEKSDYNLFVITPKMSGVYSIAELVECCFKKPHRTIFLYLKEDEGENFDEGQIRSLDAVGKMVVENNGGWFFELSEVAKFLNGESEVEI
jgi:hypothetical protein